MQKTFEFVLKKALAGKTPDKEECFRTQLMFPLTRDPFWVWCEYHAPREEAVEEGSGYDHTLRHWANDHRKDWVRSRHPKAVWVPPAFALDHFKATLKAMFDGAPAIRSPHLWTLGKKMIGQGDLLVRNDSHPSYLGPYHYRTVEIKRAKWMKNIYKLQGAVLTRILGEVQGYTPPEFEVALLDGVTKVSYEKMKKLVDDILKKWRAIKKGTLKPDPFLLDFTRSPWRLYANKILREQEDLTLLPEIDPGLREKIKEDLGVSSLKELKKLTLKKLKKTLGDQIGFDIFHSTLAHFAQKPILPEGLSFRVPRAERHLYFDFELSDEMQMNAPAHVYLIGLWDGEEEKFVAFQGRGEQDEERVFKEFLEYVGAAENCRLYHWSDFEIRHMKKVAEKYPSLADGINKVIHSSVDLMKVIKHHVFLPITSYSIKNVAPYLGFNWRQKDVGGFETIKLYLDYVERGNESAMQKIVTYNEDDCKAMWFVDKVLTSMFPQ